MAAVKCKNMLPTFSLLEILCIKERNRKKKSKIYIELTPMWKILSKRNLRKGVKVRGQIHKQKTFPNLEVIVSFKVSKARI